ncbi:hypothetical protein B0H13DRAFT_776772 [Mycena leptocephala]|nr:hypothetical protein B0H13DRAFT_776772 [Mycena leptocephala]
MPSIARAILLAVQAASFLALTGISPTTTTALASPLSGSSLARSANSPSSLLGARIVSKHTDAKLIARTPTLSPTISPAVSSLQQRHSTNNHSEAANKLMKSRDACVRNAAAMKNLTAHARTRSVQADDPEFQKQCGTTATEFKDSFNEYQKLFCSYGPSIDDCQCVADSLCIVLQETLKDVVNAHKDVLKATTELVYELPLLGPVLGPTLYDIKCLIDDLLNKTQEFVDCLLKVLLELGSLRLLLSSFSDLVCALLLGLFC